MTDSDLATAPKVIVIAGPNGAGKSTTAHALLRDAFAVPVFVNADEVAAMEFPDDPVAATMSAGRTMLDVLPRLRRVGQACDRLLTAAGRAATKRCGR